MRLLFFLSGAASLIYQVLWTRQLSLVFGNTIQAASTTVACFLLGLGLGAALGGKIGPRRTNLGRDFALAEFSVALCGLLVTATIPHIASWVPALGANPTVVRFCLVFLLLILPCLAMGITLPLLCQREERLAPGHFGRALGSLYSINTLGAACGARATDFVLVPHLGVHATVLVAGALNLTVAVLAFATGKPSAPDQIRDVDDSPDCSTFSSRACLFLLGLSGFIGLSLEILWIRVLAFVNGGDVYAFSETLFVYLVGIVLGSLAAGFATERRYRLDKLTTTLFAALSLTSVLSLWVAVSLPNRSALPHYLSGIPYEYLRLVFAGAILLPSNLCLGALFPILNTLLRGSRRDAAAAVGLAYFWNTVGSLLGSLSTGFLLIPALGMQKSLFIVGGVCALVGGWLAVRTVRTVSTRAIAAFFLLVYWTGLALVPPNAAVLRLFNEPSQNVMFLTEDHYGTVALIRQHEAYEADDYTNLIIDGFNMAGNSRTAKRYTAMLALAPMLLAPEPKNVLVVAFGLCNTLTTAVRLPDVHVDCAELSPRVVEATSRLDYARRTLQSDKLNIIFGDGRNHLTSTKSTYDVITAEPPPPTHAGIVNLYSREYYELCRGRLNAHGVVAQWLPIDQMSKFESQTIVRAFVDVFPNSYVWCGADAHLILIGSVEPVTLDYERVKKVFAANQDWLSVAGWDDPALFVASCVSGPKALTAYVQNIPPLTDDRPYIQYWDGPRNFDIGSYEETFPSPELSVIHADSPADRAAIEKASGVLRSLSRFQYFGTKDSLFNELLNAVQRWDILAAYPDSQYFQTVTQSSPRHFEQYRAIAARNPSGHWLLARTLAGRGDLQQALDEMALWKDPSPTRSALEAMILARAGRVAEVEKIVRETDGLPPPIKEFLEREKTHWSKSTP